MIPKLDGLFGKRSCPRDGGWFDAVQHLIEHGHRLPDILDYTLAQVRGFVVATATRTDAARDARIAVRRRHRHARRCPPPRPDPRPTHRQSHRPCLTTSAFPSRSIAQPRRRSCAVGAASSATRSRRRCRGHCQRGVEAQAGRARPRRGQMAVVKKSFLKGLHRQGAGQRPEPSAALLRGFAHSVVGDARAGGLIAGRMLIR